MVAHLKRLSTALQFDAERIDEPMQPAAVHAKGALQGIGKDTGEGRHDGA